MLCTRVTLVRGALRNWVICFCQWGTPATLENLQNSLYCFYSTVEYELLPKLIDSAHEAHLQPLMTKRLAQPLCVKDAFGTKLTVI